MTEQEQRKEDGWHFDQSRSEYQLWEDGKVLFSAAEEFCRAASKPPQVLYMMGRGLVRFY